MSNVLARGALALALCILGACASSRDARISKLYRDYERDLAAKDDAARLAPSSGPEQKARIVAVREIVAAEELESGDDYFEASILLVESDDSNDLALAHALGTHAAEMGEARGLRVAAEAFDKQMMRTGMHQRYGTQYVYDTTTRKWHLYPCDPRTTDDERRAMGVEPMAELLRKEELLNTRFRKPTPYELATKKHKG